MTTFRELNGITPGVENESIETTGTTFRELNGYGIQQTASGSLPKAQAPKEQGWGEWAADLPKRAGKAYMGKQDPTYKNVPAYDRTKASESSGKLMTGMFGGADDTAYGDIIQKQLGDKFIRRFKDANGYEIVEHKGDDGTPTQAYVNKPGMDVSDVTRGALSAVPYVAGGLAMGAAKGISLAGQVIGQGLTAGATSLAGDMASNAAGSEQTPDFGKTALATGTAGAATGLAPAVGGLWRRFIVEPSLVTGGKLTPKGIEVATKAGVNPAELDGKIAEEFAKTYAKTGNAAEAAIGAQSKAYGVETTLGQRTKDPQQILKEKNMRMGIYGDPAKTMMTEFDKRQAEQIQGMMVRPNNTTPSAMPQQPGMAQRLDPSRLPHEINPQAIGTDIAEGTRAARGIAKTQEKDAWSQVSDLVPKASAGAFDDLPAIVGNKLGTMRLSSSTPQAMAMDEAMSKYASGEVIASGSKLIKQAPVQTVDDMRRHLKDIYQSTDPKNKADIAASKAMYEGFNDWVKDASKRSLLAGDPAAAANMASAVDVTKSMHQIFKPTGQGFKPNASTRIMGKILDEGTVTPEHIVSSLFSAGKAEIKDGAVQTLKSIKAGLDRYKPADAADTWNAVRSGHYMQLVMGKDGQLLSPTVMKKNIDIAMNNQRSVTDILYTNAEKMELSRIQRVLGSVAWKDPNPSGTATALGSMAKEFLGTIMSALPKPIKAAIEFSKVPQAFGTVSAKSAVQQGGRTTTNPLLGAPAAVAGNALYGNQ